MSFPWRQRSEDYGKAVANVKETKARVMWLENRHVWAFTIQGVASSFEEAKAMVEKIYDGKLAEK